MALRDVGVTYSPPSAKAGGTFESKLKIYLVDDSGYCGDYASSVEHAGSRSLKIQLERTGNSLAAAESPPSTESTFAGPSRCAPRAAAM